MLKITQDEGKTFDELSIFNVKIEKSQGITKEKNIDNFTKLAREIINQIGKTKYDDILNSDEYHDLYQENLRIFLMVDELNIHEKENNLSPAELIEIAIKINSTNYARYLAKQKLQSKFFNSEVSEVKVGYQ